MKQLPTSGPIGRYLSALLPPVLWAGLIFGLSNQSVLPGFTISLYDFLFKKSAHIFVYAVLYFLIWRAIYLIKRSEHALLHLFSSHSTNYISYSWWLPLLLCILYAITDELHQSLVGGRHATLRDVGFDTLGAGMMMLRLYGYI